MEQATTFAGELLRYRDRYNAEVLIPVYGGALTQPVNAVADFVNWCVNQVSPPQTLGISVGEAIKTKEKIG